VCKQRGFQFIGTVKSNRKVKIGTHNRQVNNGEIFGSVAKKVLLQKSIGELFCGISRQKSFERFAKTMVNPFKWRHYQGEIIMLCVRWYLHYALSYRDLEEMMSERGSHDDLPLGSTFCTGSGKADATSFEEE